MGCCHGSKGTQLTHETHSNLPLSKRIRNFSFVRNEFQTDPEGNTSKDDIAIRAILIESFYLSGYLHIYLNNETKICQKYKDLDQLMSVSKEIFYENIVGFNVTQNIAFKIYDRIQYKRKHLYSSDDDIEPNSPPQNEELNEIAIKFESGELNKDNYQITLKDVDIRSFTPHKNELVLRIKPHRVERFRNIYNTPIMNNPLVILLGISEFMEVHCEPLIGVKYDMIACHKLFGALYGYDIYPNYSATTYYGKQFWYHYEVHNFFNYVIENELIKNQKNYDGVIVVISTYIDTTENVIYASDEVGIDLDEIFRKFSHDHLSLIDLRQLFIIDGKTIHIEADIECKDEQIEESRSIFIHNMNQIHDLGNNADHNGMKLLHRSKNDETRYMNEDLYEDDGCSIFIKAWIKELKKYMYHKPYKHLQYTLALNQILQNLQLNIYKNGDLLLNEMKMLKKNNDKIVLNATDIITDRNGSLNLDRVDDKLQQIHKQEKRQKKFTDDLKNMTTGNDLMMNNIVVAMTTPDDDVLYESESHRVVMDDPDTQSTEKNDVFTSNKCETYLYEKQMIVSIRVYCDMKSGQIIKDISKYSMLEIASKIKKKLITEETPQTAIIIDIDTRHKNKYRNTIYNSNNTLYLVKLLYDGSATQLWIKLRSIYGLQFHSEMVYGKEVDAKKHRYLKVMVINKSSTDTLKLLIKGYEDGFRFLVKPKYLKVPPSASHCYYIIGKLDRSLYGDSNGETGVFGVIEYDVINTNMKILCGFKKQDKKNPNKDLPKPFIYCDYVNKDKAKQNQWTKLLKKSSHNSNERVSCELDEINSSNSVIYVFS